MHWRIFATYKNLPNSLPCGRVVRIDFLNVVAIFQEMMLVSIHLQMFSFTVDFSKDEHVLIISGLLCDWKENFVISHYHFFFMQILMITFVLWEAQVIRRYLEEMS